MKRSEFPLLILILLELLLISTPVFSQGDRLTQKIVLEWTNDIPILKTVIQDDNQQLDIYDTPEGYKLFYQFRLNNSTNFNYTISEAIWTNEMNGNNDWLSQYDKQVAIASKERYGIVEIPIQHSKLGTVYRIASFNLNIHLIPSIHSKVNRTFSTISVLNSGDFFKFGIPETGIYKLSYQFLSSLGLAVDEIPISNYSVFGQNGGMLPKLAGTERVDDLMEIPIQVVSNSATLQPGDYIIFYGEGPEKWIYNPSLDRFTHENHLYDDQKSYFITPNGGSGKRVAAVSSPSGVSDVTYSSFDDYAFVENDVVNLNKSGSDWLGDEFGTTLQKTYSFNFPNLVSSNPAFIDCRTVARSSSTSSFAIKYNGSDIANLNMAGVNLSIYTSPVGSADTESKSFNVSGNEIRLDVVYNQPNFSANGWLDYIALNVSRALQMSTNELRFRVIDSKDQNIVTYSIGNASGSTSVWDVSDLFSIGKVNTTLNGNFATFKSNTGSIRQFIAFNSVEREPIAYGKIKNQNLHGLSDAGMIIITREAFLNSSNELADFHASQEGLVSHVVTLDQIYNEFSSGTNDITAIRDFLKMFYERNDNYPKYVLLFGDGSFNNRSLEDTYLPTFQSTNTLTTLETFVSDDFFVLLDDNEGVTVESTASKLDMAIGRIPANTISQASTAVEKIKRYYNNAAYGNWRNIGTYIADDEDSNLHLIHAEENGNDFITEVPKMNIEKIYLDAYRQVAGSGGGFYPDVNEAIARRIFKGTLFFNYIGHGGTNGLAEERVVRIEDIEAWDNYDKLTLIISATCEFTRYDDFESFSAGERSFFKEDGGAIALVTTVRLVFASKNREMNLNFMDAMKEGIADKSLTLGDITKIAKNETLTGSGNRKFALIGDPALKLAFPVFNVVTTKINSQDFANANDTLKALTTVTIEGEVRGLNDQILTGFNGLVFPTVYDKVRSLYTLENDEESNITSFNVQNNIIYAGKVQAIGGKFSYTFVVPKDIIYVIGNGKISYYAHDDEIDASGIDTVLVGGGGQLDSSSIDSDDPIVDVFMDNELFISGDFTTESPDLLVNLFDANGINTVGSGVGHDLVATLDGDNQNGIVLNDFYESELNSYQRGKVKYPLEKIAFGTHTIKVKAWDVFNNSGEGATDFVVAESAELALDHVLNYPNPFTTNTQFMFEHNRKGEVLDIRIEIFSVSGKLIKTIQETALSESRNVALSWDGLDQYGDKIGKGVYVYRVSLKDSGGNKTQAFQKLVLLR